MRNSSGTLTDPTTAMRPRSLRSRSTIIRFSARFLMSSCSRRAVSLSPSGARVRGAVPFIGRACSRPRSWRTNSSGERDSTHSIASPGAIGSRIKAPNPTRWRARRRR